MLDRQRSRKSRRSKTTQIVDAPDGAYERPLLNEVPATPRWQLLFVLAIPVLATSFCGSREPWAIGMVALAAGLCLLALPARFQVPRGIALSMGAILLLCFATLLPAPASQVPAWRKALEEAMGIRLGTSFSPEPWTSLESGLVLTTAACWLAWCLSRGFGEKDRRFLVQGLVLAVVGLAIAAIAVRYYQVEVPFWTGPSRSTYYGPFTNRNNFSGLLAPGAVLAFAAAYDAHKRGKLTKLLFALCVVPIFSALLFNTSRIGVVLFFTGLGCWMVSGAFARRSVQQMAVSASLMLVLATAFLIFGQHILERFTAQGGLAATLGTDGRIAIFGEALRLLSRHPVLGTGLGNFQTVYALNETRTGEHAIITRVAHPESDWLWFGIEAGGVALALAILCLFLITRRFGQWKKHESLGRSDRRLRAAAGVSVFLLAIEGIVDTPLHTIGLATFGSLLAGLALAPPRGTWKKPSIPFLRYAGSGFCMICGSLWLMIGLGDPVVPGKFSARLLIARADSLNARGDHAAALIEINRALEMRPLQWDYYYRRARTKLRLGRPPQDALMDFGRARALEPHHAQICMDEANFWLKFAPSFSIPALREAMRRDRRNAYSYYEQMLAQIRLHPELRRPLRDLADDSRLKLLYLRTTSGEDFKMQLRELIEGDSTLSAFSREHRLQFFDLWYQNGDREALLRELASNTSWRADGWTILASHAASQGKFREACELAQTYLPEGRLPKAPPEKDLSRLNRDFLFNPTDISRGIHLYQAQKAEGLATDAIRTMRELMQLPDAPTVLHYDYAILLAKLGDYPKAWEQFQIYRNKLQNS